MQLALFTHLALAFSPVGRHLRHAHVVRASPTMIASFESSFGLVPRPTDKSVPTSGTVDSLPTSGTMHPPIVVSMQGEWAYRSARAEYVQDEPIEASYIHDHAPFSKWE